MKHAYLDTSVVLRYILGEPKSYPALDKFHQLYASELMRVEALRTLDRLRIQHQWPTKETASRVQLLTALSAALIYIPLQTPILRRASDPFPTIVGTLDALHIATALLTQEHLKNPLLFLTHDIKQGLAANAAGLTSKGF